MKNREINKLIENMLLKKHKIVKTAIQNIHTIWRSEVSQFSEK